MTLSSMLSPLSTAPSLAPEVVALEKRGDREAAHETPEGSADVKDGNVRHRDKERYESTQRELAAEGHAEGGLQHPQHREPSEHRDERGRRGEQQPREEGR